MALNKVEICGLDTSKLPMMTQKRSRELLLRVKAGDEEARETFIRENLRLVLSVIQRFAGRSEQMDDLFQVGCIGLIKALDNFDLSHNVRFSTYAVPMIIGEVRRHLRDNNALRVSRSIRDMAYKALQVRTRLTEELGREPKSLEIAKAMELPEEEVTFALDAIQDPVSLFEPIYHDDGDAIYVMDQVRDDKNSDEQWMTRIMVDAGLDKLSDRERRIIELRFFQGRTQIEVAGDIGIRDKEMQYVSERTKAAYGGYYTCTFSVRCHVAM